MKDILVVIDMQNDFITGSLGTKEAQAIVPKIVSKISAYHEAGKKVIFTRDTHTEEYLMTAEGKKLPVKHCIQGTWGWEIEESLQKVMPKDSLIIDKVTFGAVALGETIRKAAQEEEMTVELVGLCTDICVISNALLIKAYAPETQISVVSSCCAGVTPESHENALKAMAMCQIDIIKEEK